MYAIFEDVVCSRGGKREEESAVTRYGRTAPWSLSEGDNPLLETISSLAYDDSDEGEGSKPPEYSGSIDSGYKSGSSSVYSSYDKSRVRPSSGLYDVDLDQLMYLRQSLLSAIRKRKTVRFEPDLKKDASSPRKEAGGPPKSILKDPLCANLRSKLEEEPRDDQNLEQEIDSLLYGRAEFYDLDNVEEFPSSYVTMIEDKYRKTSVAKVRKLKDGKEQEASKTRRQDKTPVSEPKKRAKSSVAIDKCRFTEVARCMLEIIEDLQLKKPEEIAAQDPQDPSDCYATAADYHVYEEIDYDFVGRGPTVSDDPPPPLPARPAVPPPPQKGSNLPKQRGNLYCLFSDRALRRNLSKSLEKESAGNPQDDDDYGFKEFQSI